MNSEITKYVLDGGSLIHKIKWEKGMTYEEIALLYANYVVTKYGSNATIIFDGYESGNSTKDMTHRIRNNATGPKINFNEKMKFQSKKDIFLSNSFNKQRMIYLIGEKLTDVFCTVVHSKADADVNIAKSAIAALSTNNIFLIGEDTDLLILMLYFVPEQSNFKLYFGSNKENVYDIYKIRALLGSLLCSCLPFIHAITGCDTTSGFFGIGKKTAVKRCSITLT